MISFAEVYFIFYFLYHPSSPIWLVQNLVHHIFNVHKKLLYDPGPLL